MGINERQACLDTDEGQLVSLDFCAIDFETANPKRGSVCAVGVVRVRDGIITDRFDTLIRPPADLFYFAPMNVGVHGIQLSSVLDAPTWTETLTMLEFFIDEDFALAHNASFETSVLRQASEAERLPLPQVNLLCTLAIARHVFPGLPRHRLPDIVAACGVEMGMHHDAAADAEASAMIAVAMARKMGCDDIATLMKVSGSRLRSVA